MKDAEILRLIEERRNTPKEEKQRLKEVSKCITKCIRDKKRKGKWIFKEFLKTSKEYEISRESKQERREYSSRS